MTDPSYATATEILALMDAGEVTSRELVEHQLDRIGRLDGEVHAVVTLDDERALHQADERDAERRAGRVTGPLHGLPMTVKDAFATAGTRTTAGMNELAGHVPDRDAVAVARLRRAGAIVVGKTACPEGVTGQETANALTGTTRNPWDQRRTTGGSSGGAAAALAAGFTPLELGSDMGGSIRQPASFCGVFGHYPTRGVVPLRGHLPSVPVDDLDPSRDLTAVGPMARSAADLTLALEVLAGPDDLDARAWRLELPAARITRPAELRVACWFDDPDFPVASEVVEVLSDAADALADAGASVDAAARPAFDLVEAERVGFDLWVAAASASLEDEQAVEQAQLAETVPPHDDRRVARRAQATAMSHRQWLALDRRRAQLRRAWEELFRDVDVLLCPVVPVVAFPVADEPQVVDRMTYRLERTLTVDGVERPYLDQLVWTTAVGLADLPSTSTPVGLSRSGLPVGAQVVGRAFDDRTTLRVASMLNRLTGGFRVPPSFRSDVQLHPERSVP